MKADVVMSEEIIEVQKNEGREILRIVLGVGSLVILCFAFFLILVQFMDKSWILYSLSFKLAVIVYFTLIFPHVSFIVPKNKAWIMVDEFVQQDPVSEMGSRGFRKIQGQYEFQAGFYFKLPWEVFSQEINMVRQIPVKSDPNRTYRLKDGKTIKVEWQITVVHLPGHLTNFSRTLEEEIIRRVKTRAEAFLQGYIGSRTKIGFDKRAKEKLEEEFETLYGGPNYLDPEERELGIWTGTPEIFDISDVQKVEDAKNFEAVMESLSKSAQKMVKDFKGGLSPQEATRIAMLMQSGAKVDLVDLTGVLGGGGQSQKKKGGGK